MVSVTFRPPSETLDSSFFQNAAGGGGSRCRGRRTDGAQMVSPGEGGLTSGVGSPSQGQVKELGYGLPHCWGEGGALSRGIWGTQPHEEGRAPQDSLYGPCRGCRHVGDRSQGRSPGTGRPARCAGLWAQCRLRERGAVRVAGGRGDPVSLGTSMCGGVCSAATLALSTAQYTRAQNPPFSLKKRGDHRFVSLEV